MTAPSMDELSPAEALIRKLAEPEQLQHVDRLATVGRLAAGIIHELGTPLNVIGSYAQMIATGEVTGDEVAEPARAIEDQVKRMSRIIRQLLDFARRNVVRQEPVEVLALAQQTVNLLKPYAIQTGAALSVESDEEGPLVVEGSSGLLQQVLVNLVTNAVQAMPAGGRITLEASRHHGPPPEGGTEQAWILLHVRDEGTGVPPETREQIFAPFFTTKDPGTGTGLGLAVCTDILREHGGWMALEETEGPGASFCVALPEYRTAKRSE